VSRIEWIFFIQSEKAKIHSVLVCGVDLRVVQSAAPGWCHACVKSVLRLQFGTADFFYSKTVLLRFSSPSPPFCATLK
jgi:hypothetical protein